MIPLIILISAFVQGFAAFGASLIALPLTLIYLPISVVVPMLVTFNFLMNANLTYHQRKDVNPKKIAPLIISATLFTVVGAYFLKGMDAKYIKVVIGAVLIVMSLTQLFGVKVRLKNARHAFIPVGIASGLLNGMAGLSGPPVLIFLSSLDMSKKEFKSTLSGYFLLLNIVSIVTFLFNGIYTLEVLKQVVLNLPFLFIGLYLGMKTSHHVADHHFKTIILLITTVFGILLLT